MSEKLDRIRDKIRALLEKTIENGATEHEALAAAEKARELMLAYNVEASPEETRARGAVILRSKAAKNKSDPLIHLAAAVARYTDCHAWRSEREVFLCGAPGDAEFALYLYESLTSARNASFKNWKIRGDFHEALAASDGSEARLFRGFSVAFVNRVAARLRAMRDAEKTPAATSNAGALVVVKNALIAEAMAGLNLTPPKRKTRARAPQSAFAAGDAAGASARLGRPIGQGANAVRRIV